MDKNAIKKYAVWARNELFARVTQKAEQYEITEKKTTPKDDDSIGGRLLTDAEKNQRKTLIEKIQADGFEQVMEEVAYTWFNRFTALRFMEVNNYLPSHTRVFTNEAGEFKPQILADAIQLDLEGLDMDKVFELKDANKTEELYKYLLITQCNALSAVLPRMFQKIEHYTELLLPDYLLREGSVIEQMIALIPEEDWTDQVQIIGWLYQYYNSEPKDAVFAALKKNVKISKENIPAATQLFTPDWIVRYMVENSLGRLWLEGHPNDSLKSEWNYYLDEAEQESNVQKQLDEIRKGYAELKPEDIRCIDPCMGSGHILCYMFDVLVKIYEDYGYTAREAVGNIVEKNLWGLDIDDRAAQLSYFAVMMKARQYDRRFLTRKIQPHVYAIVESNGITSASMHDMGIELFQEEYGEAAKQAMRLVEEMHDAKEYGSLIDITSCDWNLLRRFAIPRAYSEGQMSLDIYGEIEASERLHKLINVGEAISQKYHIVITNPPYMGSSGMDGKLDAFAKKRFPDSRSDLFAMFIEKGNTMINIHGFNCMVTMQSWMFLPSFEKLRKKIYRNVDITNLMHMENMVMHIAFGTAVTVFRKTTVSGYKGTYNSIKLSDLGHEEEKPITFPVKENRFAQISTEKFSVIPGAPVAYWVSNQVLSCYEEKKIYDYAKPCKGIDTGDNNVFLRFWHEVSIAKLFIPDGDDLTEEDFRKNKWFPYNKGGNYRKWYGNNEYVLNWENNGLTLRNFKKSNLRNKDRYFKKGITWSTVTSGNSSFRYFTYGFLFDNGGSCLFAQDNLFYIQGLLNSCVSKELLSIQPTINNQPGTIGSLPMILSDEKDKVTHLVQQNIELAKAEWDSEETSWDFQLHPLVPMVYERQEQLNAGMNTEARMKTVSLLSERYIQWEQECEYRFTELKKNEEELNRIFINIYGLQDELSPEIDDKDVTISKANLSRDIRSLISYAVGCMFGRYSLDIPGLAYAGGEWDSSKYKAFLPDKDAIIPVCDDEYFEDDIVGRFVSFIKTVYGENTLEENLRFIADALGGKGTSRDIIRNYFINSFYTDHLRIYQKRPIYWMFDSGKKNGFKCLVYMHRYQPDTIARIRTDYVHEQQSRYRTAIANLENRINGAGTSERVKLNKQLLTLQDQATEIREYEEKIHHLADQMISIDLDDGVKHNYEIFKDVLAKIK